MKRYILNAEFVRWKSTNRNESEKDSMTYVMELESDEEAKTRLDTLVIERMSSKPGWSFMLLSSGYSEFSGESNTTVPDEITHINTSVTSDLEILETPAPEFIQIPLSEIPVMPEQEMPQNHIEEETPPAPDMDLSGTKIEPDQLQV